MTGRHDSKGHPPDGRGTPSRWTMPAGVALLSAMVWALAGHCDDITAPETATPAEPTPGPSPSSSSSGDASAAVAVAAPTASASSEDGLTASETGTAAAPAEDDRSPFSRQRDEWNSREDPHADPGHYEGDWRHWPLPHWCVYLSRQCTTPAGEIGLACGNDTVCWNPCPKGRAPWGPQCYRTCLKNADCDVGTCVKKYGDAPDEVATIGTCNRLPNVEGCTGGSCIIRGGGQGVVCGNTCVNYCPPGMFNLTDGNCVKGCSSDADCDGIPGVCGIDMEKGTRLRQCLAGSCPTGSCPYRYD